MNLKFLDYFSPIFRWWWLLIVCALVAGGVGYALVNPLPPVYQSGITLLVGNALDTPNPSSLEVEIPRRLTDAYAAMALREPVRDGVKKALGLDELPKYTAYTIPGSTMVRIEVTDTNPRRAQAVATELGRQLMAQSPGGTTRDSETQAFLEEQLHKIADAISETEQDIAAKQEEMATAEGASAILSLQADLDALNNKLATLQENYARLLASSQSNAINTLRVVEEATLPTRPIGPNKVLDVAAATLGGLILATLGAYGIEYLDDRLKTETHIQHLVHYSLTGYIPTIYTQENPVTYLRKRPRSPAADAFRSIRNALGYLADAPYRTLLVSSAAAGEGKSTVAAGLAISLAQAGYRVILVDADLRAPSLHTMLGLPQKPGLSDVLQGKIPLAESIIMLENLGIDLLTSGDIPDQSTELLASRAMQTTMAQLGQSYDVVVLDGPPFAVPDAVVLARRVEGMLWVIRVGYSRRTAVKYMQEQIEQTLVNVLGVVINCGRGPRAHYYQVYGYHGYYQDGNGRERRKPAFRRLVENLRRTK
ncbi:MAG: polysaccharide biosynthesis tyrosine autokinase [Anaerolineae bacterium]|nr:MAG: polysaccharide biosynthesis tyrosine autokinase [Anaerolineae bacterium]